MTQVHKETLTIIENALPNRSGLDVEIFGMEGIPDDIVQSHNQRVLQQFAQAEAERRAATGNSGLGALVGGAAKKPKFESPSDLKKRLAEHKAKKAAEEATGISSGDVTPGGLGHGSQSPGLGQSPGNYVSCLASLLCYSRLKKLGKAGSPGYPPPQTPFGGPPNNSTYSSYPQPYGQQQPPFQQQPSPFPNQQPPFSPPGMPPYQNNQAFAPPQQFQQPPGGPGFQPQFPNGPSQQFHNGPPQFQNGPPQYQNGPPPQYQNGPPQFHNGPLQSFGAGSPPPFQQSQFQPPRTHTPPQHNNGMPQRPGSLPPAPGLPQRPSFGAPPVNAFQMQQMHQGQLPGPPNPPDHSHNNQQNASQQPGVSGGAQNGALGAPPTLSAPVPNPLLEPPTVLSANASSLDDLVSGAAKDADKAAGATESKLDTPRIEEPPEEKKGKKEKDKNTKLVYSDNDVSPEEKMAQMPRYAFAPSG